MALVIITFRVMPEDPTIDLVKLEAAVKKEITHFGGEVAKVDVQEVAFGLKSINLMFTFDEKKGDTEPLEEKIGNLPGVSSVEVTDVRRAIG